MRCSAGGFAFGKVVTIGWLRMRQVTIVIHLVATTGLGTAAIAAERVVLAMPTTTAGYARRTACRYRKFLTLPMITARICTLGTLPAAVRLRTRTLRA